MKKLFGHRRHSLTGFTLIETFIAITILLAAIAGPLTIASRGLSSALLAKQQTTASYLAQEGIEFVRYTRDGNALSLRSWLSGLSACTNGSCYVDVINNTAAACSGSCPAIRYNSTTGFYTYNLSDTATEFTRSVTITVISADEAQVISSVTWFSLGSTHRFTAAENIFNWQ